MNHVSHFLSSIHIWSTKRILQPAVTQHPAIHIYHEKHSVSVDLDPYCAEKKKYAEAQDIPWSLSNKRPEKLREALNEAEEWIERCKVICIHWKSSRNFQIALCNGVILHYTIAVDSQTIERLFIDKSLITVKTEDFFADVILRNSFAIFTFKEKHKLILVDTSKKMPSLPDGKETDLKISTIKLPGCPRQSLKRNISINRTTDLVCVWWPRTFEDGWPWSPMISEEDRANMVIFNLSCISSVYAMEVLAYIQTDGNPLDICFSLSNPYRLLCIEQYQSSKSNFVTEDSLFEIIDRKITKIWTSPLPLESKMTCYARDFTEKKIALVCEENALMIWNSQRKKFRTIKLLFACEHIRWHPNNFILLVASSFGDIQIFDMVLNCIHLCLISDIFLTSPYLQLTTLFFATPRLNHVSWSCDYGYTSTPDSKCCCDDLLLILDRGPICILRIQLGVCTLGVISPIEIMCEYIRYQQHKEAVTFLGALSWDDDNEDCFNCLLLLTDHIFKLPLNASREACLEEALGTFYAPGCPISETSIIKYRDDIGRIARKFFHRLLRYKRFEKAFLLAVDIGAKDLFLDIYYLAKDERNFELAAAAKKRAIKLHYQDEDADDLPPDFLCDDDLCEDSLSTVSKQLEKVDINDLQKEQEETIVTSNIIERRKVTRAEVAESYV